MGATSASLGHDVAFAGGCHEDQNQCRRLTRVVSEGDNTFIRLMNRVKHLINPVREGREGTQETV
jgi:hypothetical protein